MTPILTLYKKELRQHGILAMAMVFMCLLFQIAFVETYRFAGFSIDGGAFFGIVLLITVLYAGAAAALAYSTEHAENTFVFLRKLPVSWATVAGGKTAWVLCGTMLVLLGNLLLYGICIGTGYVTETGFDAGHLWLAIGVGIIEVFAWGLFWSTRCRSQVHALLATYVCASTTAFALVNLFFEYSPNVIEMYAHAVPYRLAAAGIVAIFAVWGMFRWFSFEAKRPLLARLYPEKITLGYPQKVQRPLSALIHHHIRHASLLYPLGILCMALWTVGCTIACVSLFIFPRGLHTFSGNDPFWFQALVSIGIIGCIVGMALFWATLFGHDQKNNSYQFLSRLGIPEGAVWWSRMLPALILYSLVIFGVVGFHLTETLLADAKLKTSIFDNTFRREYLWVQFWLNSAIYVTVWLVPVAVGAFMSISFRSQLVAISLTGGGLCLLFAWMMIGMTLFGFSPGWTTLPICIALVIASRIRAGYWLRETFTWRSRIIPLVPVFATALAIMIAVPFVRVYSVPDVSWEQINAFFDKTDLPGPQAPEKRRALIQYIAEHRAVPPEYEALYAQLNEQWRMAHIGDHTAEEYLLVTYVFRQHYVDQFFTAEFWDNVKGETIQRLVANMPWEKVRSDRIMRLQIVGALAQSGGLQDNNAEAILHRLATMMDWSHEVVADEFWQRRGYFMHVLDERNVCFNRFRNVASAMDKWYAEHGTLPESLDELVIGKYLDRFPVHFFTQEAMEYHQNAPPPEDITREDIGFHILAEDRTRARNWREFRDSALDTFHQSGGTYLRLGKWVYVIVSQEAEVRRQETEEDRKQEEREETDPQS